MYSIIIITLCVLGIVALTRYIYCVEKNYRKSNKQRRISMFWIRVSKKIIENLISVKVWIMFSYLAVSTILLVYGFIDGTMWVASNGGIISTVVACREAFKVAKVKSSDDTKDMVV